MNGSQKRTGTEVRYRSGAAARRAEMSAATLRVWERRYSIVNPARSATGQRLYSDHDIQRLRRLKRLVDRGYAIGTVARLTIPQLDDLIRELHSVGELTNGAHRWALVGRMFGQRLRRWGVCPPVVEEYSDVSEALDKLEDMMADLIIVHSPSLREEHVERLLTLKQRHPDNEMAVVYSFAVGSALGALRAHGIRLARDPLTRAQFEQLIGDLVSARDAYSKPDPKQASRSPPQFSDDQLARFEEQSAAVRCECPAHLVNLIFQTAAFESYSNECAIASEKDADLHRYLGDLANQARVLFEKAVERVARQEQISLGMG